MRFRDLVVSGGEGTHAGIEGRGTHMVMCNPYTRAEKGVSVIFTS